MSVVKQSPSRPSYRFVDHGGAAFVGDIHIAEQLGVEGFTKQVRIWNIRPELCEKPGAQALLLSDLRSAAELSAFSISQLLNVWTEGESTIVLATEHLSGLTLEQLNERSTPGAAAPLPALLAVGLEVARALEHAHDPHVAGGVVVHGDIRPEHLLIGHEGAVKLTGFGFARFLHFVDPDGEWLTWQGRRFQPPERDRVGAPLDPRADIYALGLVLLEAFCAGIDSAPTELDALVAQLHAGKLGATLGLPEDVAEVLSRACAETPDERYPDATELAADLHRLLLERGRVSSSSEIVRKALRGFAPLASPTRETALPDAAARPSAEFTAPALRISEADVRFVGRNQILRTVAQSLAATAQGTGGALLIRGEPGMGRSRLLTEIGMRLEGSRRRVAWLHIAGSPSEQAVQFSAVLRLLGAAVGLAPDADLSELAQAVDRFRALGLEAAELEAIRALLGAEAPPDPARLAGLLSEAVIRCVASLAWEQTTVVAWDDLQWADDASLGCLYELLCRVSSMPTIVALTAPVRHELPWSLPEGSTEQTLKPLSRSACEEFLIQKIGEATWVDSKLLERLIVQSGGNPLLLDEMTDLLDEAGRLDVEDRGLILVGDENEPLPHPADVVRERTSDLDDQTRQVAFAAAVAGPALSHDFLAEATDIPAASVERCLAQLAGQPRILKWTPSGFAFRHERSRRAVLASASPDQLDRLRSRVAQAILSGVDRPARGLDDHAARLLAEVGEKQHASDVLLQAARREEARGDLRGAAERYVRALLLGRQAGSLSPAAELELCMSAGRAAIHSLHLDLGRGALQDAVEIADREGAPEQRAEARVLLCRLLARQGHLSEAMDRAQEAMPLAESSDQPLVVAQVCGAIAESCQQWGQYGPDMEYIERALRIATEARDRQRAGEYLQLAVSHAVGVGKYDRIGPLLERARKIGSANEDALLTCQLHKVEGLSLYFKGQPEAALKVNLEGIALAHANGLSEPEIVMLHNCGDDYLALGQEREALYYFNESLRRSRAARFDRLTEANLMFVAFLEATYLGQDDGLERLEQCLADARQLGRIWNLTQGHRLLGTALLARGDREGGIAHLEEALRLAQETGVKHFIEEAEKSLSEARGEA